MEVYAYKYILKAFLVLVNTIPTKTCKITEAYYTHLKKNRLFVMFKLALFCYNKIFFFTTLQSFKQQVAASIFVVMRNDANSERWSCYKPKKESVFEKVGKGAQYVKETYY